MQDEKEVVHRDGTDVVDVVEIQDTSRDHVEILKIRVEKKSNYKNKKIKTGKIKIKKAKIIIQLAMLELQ